MRLIGSDKKNLANSLVAARQDKARDCYHISIAALALIPVRVHYFFGRKELVEARIDGHILAEKRKCTRGKHLRLVETKNEHARRLKLLGKATTASWDILFSLSFYGAGAHEFLHA